MGGIACITGTSATSRGHTAASPNRNRLRGPFPGDRPPPRRRSPHRRRAATRHRAVLRREGRRPGRRSHLPRPPEGRFLDRLLSRLHLGDIDSGDLLLLLILFFLFREEADEEVLIAIGLLLIL